jgi:serine/threonine protein kinase
MLTSDPAKRPTAKEVLSHDWFVAPDVNIDFLSSPRTMMAAIEKLATTRAPKRLKAEATKVLLQYITNETVSKLEAVFRELDTELTGFVTVKALQTALKKSGLMIA